MKVLKLLGLVLLLAVASNSLTLAKTPAQSPAKSRKCDCIKQPAKSKKKTPVDRLTASLDSVTQVRPRCTGRGIPVWFRRLNDQKMSPEYKYLEANSTHLIYCDGLTEHRESLSGIVEIRLNTPPPPPPPPRVTILDQPAARDPYAGQARSRKEIVVLTVFFNRNGRIGEIVMKHSSNWRLTDSAKEAAEKIKFIPAQENGLPVSIRQDVTYEFLPHDGPKPKVALIRPTNGISLRNTSPRLVSFEWTPVLNVKHYLLEIQYSYNDSTDWYSLKPIQSPQASYDFVFPGAYSGQWRVTPVLTDGTEGIPSEWSRFRFLK